MNAAVFGMARSSEGGERKAAEARELLDVVVAMAGGGGGGKESTVVVVVAVVAAKQEGRRYCCCCCCCGCTEKAEAIVAEEPIKMLNGNMAAESDESDGTVFMLRRDER